MYVIAYNIYDSLVELLAWFANDVMFAVQRDQFCIRGTVKSWKTRDLWPAWHTGSERRRWCRFGAFVQILFIGYSFSVK